MREYFSGFIGESPWRQCWSYLTLILGDCEETRRISGNLRARDHHIYYQISAGYLVRREGLKREGKGRDGMGRIMKGKVGKRKAEKRRIGKERIGKGRIEKGKV